MNRVVTVKKKVTAFHICWILCSVLQTSRATYCISLYHQHQVCCTLGTFTDGSTSQILLERQLRYGLCYGLSTDLKPSCGSRPRKVSSAASTKLLPLHTVYQPCQRVLLQTINDNHAKNFCYSLRVTVGLTRVHCIRV